MTDVIPTPFTPWQQDALRLLENGSRGGGLAVLDGLSADEWTAVGESVWPILVYEGDDALFHRALDRLSDHQMLSALVLVRMMQSRPVRLDWLDQAAERVSPVVVTPEERGLVVKAIGGFMWGSQWEAAGRLSERLHDRLERNDLESLLDTLASRRQVPAAFVNQLLGPERRSPAPQTWKAVKRALAHQEWALAGELLIHSDDTVRLAHLENLLVPEGLEVMADLLTRHPDLGSTVYGVLQAKAWNGLLGDETQRAADRLDLLASLEPMETQRRWCHLNPWQLPQTHQRVLAADRAGQAQDQAPVDHPRPRIRS